MTFRIGPVELADRVILAPMSGVTDMPFRQLVKRRGAAFVVSEMIASQAMIRQTRESLRMASHTLEEYPMAVQLAGCEPDVMAEAAKLNRDRGATIIDINMGCPVKKVVNGHAGSALMRDESHAAKILEATVKAVDIPVTLKMRTGWNDENRNAPRLAKIAEDCGIQMITIHGRTRCQLYNGKSDWPFIRNVKEAISIPVIGNGDVVTVEDAQRLLEKSKADGVMIGRGAYGRPWFLNQVSYFLKTGEKLSDPPLEEQKYLVLGHFEDMLSHYGTYTGLLMARKHLGWYSKGLTGSAEYRVSINQATVVEDVKILIENFYNRNLERNI
ncbi:MAG: tRNA dihydrouridine synthase DusB [Alphaproteobacteria bacterium]|nr:tRNA dihydrouridine synthase DusB [Alphaproteobacteria bacterium]